MSSEPVALAPPEEVSWKRLSAKAPLAALVPLSGTIGRMLLGALLPTYFAGERGLPVVLWVIVLSMAVLLLAAMLYEVATTSYRVVDAQLEIRSGVFTRTSRFIEAARVQNTEVLQPFVSKLLGLVEVKVETASGGKADGHLRGLAPEDAQALIQALQTVRGEGTATVLLPGEAAPEERVLSEAHLGGLLLYGATALGLGVIAVVMGALHEITETFHKLLLPWMEAHWDAVAAPGMGWLAATVAALAGLFGLWLVSGARAVLQFYGFRLVDTGTHLRAVGGLITRRQVTVRRARIQQVVLDEPFLRRTLGFGSVEVETAGVRTGKEAADRAELLVPVVPTARMPELLREFVPELPDAMPFQRAHPKALLRARVRAVGLSVLVAAPATWFWGAWGAVAWLLLPAQLLGAWFDWRFQGWLLTEALVVVRQGFWRRRTTVVQRSRIQSVRARQGPLERGYGIGHVRIDVAGSHVILPGVGWEEAQSLIDVLPARRPARRVSPVRLPG
ncbi:PH domain-containing protein [Corallococcus exiguus]|uniref:PH domain-containing protein n=1 Tax=Corallococcus exiguus TaxID=83462 RepID=UPI001472462D|nr:PH domain-containing protein [Corallococcus exiguus]NNB93523.1 PH domain-containing protein [Corallococcus exiguus]NNC06482.1 PH domain-containing protein [Corallococcus exiguus]